MTGEGYGDFARVYDRALGARFAKAAEPFLRSVVERHEVPAEVRHLDLAGGTFSSHRLFSSLGWGSVVLDLSLPMLEVARSRTSRLVAGSIVELPFSGRCSDVVTCLYDSVNHLLEEEALEACFAEIARVLRPDGLLIFDLNHPRAYDLIWGATDPFEDAGEGWRLKVETSPPLGDGTATAEVSGVWSTGDERFEFVEVRRQRAWDPGLVDQMVEAAGLRLQESFEFDPFEQADEAGGMKVMYVARR